MPESLLFPNRDYERVSLQLEERCQQHAQEIIRRIAGRIVRAITKHNAAYVQEDFARVGLNFLDQLSLMTARGWALDNISFGLEQFRDELVSKEILALSPLERLVMDYRDIDALLSGRVKESVAEDIRSAIDNIIREHYNTGRLQRFIYRYNY